MEILKGFVFDIQRFGNVTLTGPAAIDLAKMIEQVVGAAAGHANVAADGTVTYGTAAGADADVTLTPSASGSTEYTLALSNTITTSASNTLTFTVPSTATKLAVTGGILANWILDVSNNSTTALSATDIAATGIVKDSTGTVTLTTAAVDAATATNKVAVSGGKFTFTFAGDTSGAVVTATTNATFNVSDFACAINGGSTTEASILGTATYNTSGNLTGATAGTAAANAYTVAGTGTVTMAAIAATDKVSIDGWTYGFDKANAAGVVFTTADNTNAGATKVENVANGVALNVPATQLTMTFGNESFTRTTGNNAIDITSDGTGISNIATSLGAETFTYGVSGQGTYTINGKTIEVSGDETDGVQVTTSTTSITAVADLEAKATLNVKDGSDYLAGVTVYSATGLGNTSLKAAQTIGESDYVIVNGTTFYAGRQGAGISTTDLTLYTSTVGATLVTGTVYLDGQTATEVSVTDNTGAKKSTIATVKGDISVYASTTTGIYTVNDLDNGDAFTVTGSDGKKYSYQVVNGVVYQTDPDGVSAKNAGNVLSAGSEGKSSLSIAFGTAGDASKMGNAAIGDNVYLASVGDPIGTTKTISVSVDKKAPITSFIEGSTNYINANNVISTDSAGAIASVTYDDNAEVFTYNNLTTKAQDINISTDAKNKWIVNGGEKDDTITGNGLGSTLNGGAGNDTIDAGAKDVAFGGDGNDSIKASAAGASISGGAGADTLEATNADVTLTGGDGADVFVLNKGFISDYNFTDDVISTTKTQAQVRDLTKAVANFKSNGVLTDGTGTVTLGSANEYAVKFKTNDKKEQVVAWAGENSANLDASSLTSAVILMGNTNEAADTLIGGSKDDTIYAGAGDSVYGGAGSNTISLTGAKTTETVYFNGTGKDVVTGFATGFDEEASDKLIIDGVSSLTSSLDGSNLTIKSGSSNMVLNNVSTSGVAKVRVGDKKAIFASDTATVKLESLTDADFYYGTKGSTSSSKLDLSSIEEAVNLDLTNDTVIRNFTSVKGGAGDTTLIGSKANETLVSGGGNTSLYGGAGKDVLVGASKVKDTFFMFAGGGNDTVSGYEGYTESTADTADVVVMEELTGAKLISGGVQLSGKDADKLFISGANANTEIQYSVGNSVGIAKIGSVSGANSFTFAKEVNYYGGGSAVDTLTFNSSDSDNHQVWLDGSKGTTYASIDVVNASAATGDLVLAGDAAKNTITGGKGSSSLWGGTGATNDVLKGGTGGNTFFYGLAEGNDTITCGTADDVVNLYNVKLSDVKSGEITSSVVSVELNDGSKLTVNTGSRDIAFKLSDGSTWTANHNTKQWDNA